MVENKRIVVLGGAGFVGSHLCERLIALGAQSVTAVDLLEKSTGSIRNLDSLKSEKRFDLIEADICETIPVFGSVDILFNLASPASPVDYDRLWLETLRVGSIGTQRALELAERKQSVFVQASTSEIYGDPLVHPQREDYFGNVNTLSPRAVYDEAKRYGEAIVQAFSVKRKVKTRIARIFNTYGPRMRLNDGRVIPQLLAQALRNEDMTVFSNGSQTRSFCYVSDMVDGLIRLSVSNIPVPVNLGNPHEQTILQVANTIKLETGASSKIVFKPIPDGDPKVRKPDITRAKKYLHWTPAVSFVNGLRLTISHFFDLV